MICRLHNQNISYFVINPDIKQASSSTFKCNQCLAEDYINPNDKIISVHSANMMPDNEWGFQKDRITTYFDKVTKIHHNLVSRFNTMINNILKEIAKKMMIVKHTNFKLIEEWIKINKEQIDNYFFNGNNSTRTMLELSKTILECNDDAKVYSYYNSYIQQVKKIDQVQNLKYNKESIEFFESYIKHLQLEFIDKFDKHFVNSASNYFSQRSNLNIIKEMTTISDKFIQQEANYYEHMFNTLKSLHKPQNAQPNQQPQQTSFQSSYNSQHPQYQFEFNQTSIQPQNTQIHPNNVHQNTNINQKNLLNQLQHQSIEVQNNQNIQASKNKNKQIFNVKKDAQYLRNKNNQDQNNQGLQFQSNNEFQNKIDREQKNKEIYDLKQKDILPSNINNNLQFQKQQDFNHNKQYDKFQNRQDGQDQSIILNQSSSNVTNIIPLAENTLIQQNAQNNNQYQNLQNNDNSSENFSFNKKAQILNNDFIDDTVLNSDNKFLQNSSPSNQFINNNYSPFENLRQNGLIQNTSFDQNDYYFQDQDQEQNKQYAQNEFSNFSEQIENIIQDNQISESIQQVTAIQQQQNPEQDIQQTQPEDMSLETLLNREENDIIQSQTDQNLNDKEKQILNEGEKIIENVSNNIENLNKNNEIESKDIEDEIIPTQTILQPTENILKEDKTILNESQRDSDINHTSESQFDQNQIETQKQIQSTTNETELETVIQNENILNEQSKEKELQVNQQQSIIIEEQNHTQNTQENNNTNKDKYNQENLIDLETYEIKRIEINLTQDEQPIEIEDDIIQINTAVVPSDIQQPLKENQQKDEQKNQSQENKVLTNIEQEEIILEESEDKQKTIKEQQAEQQKTAQEKMIEDEQEIKKQNQILQKEQQPSTQSQIISNNNVIKKDKKITIIRLKDQQPIKQEQDKIIVPKQNEQDDKIIISKQNEEEAKTIVSKQNEQDDKNILQKQNEIEDNNNFPKQNEQEDITQRLQQFKFKKIIINKKSQPQNIGVQHSIKKKTIKLNIVKVSGNQNSSSQLSKQEPKQLSSRIDEDDSIIVSEDMEGFFNKKYVTK